MIRFFAAARHRARWFRPPVVCGTIALLGLLVSATVTAAATEKTPVRFALDVKPILSAKCFACHGPDPKHREGGLGLHDRRLTTGELDSGELGIVPGRPDDSEVFRRLIDEDEDLRMPPADHGPRLSTEQINTIQRWIEQGAVYEQHWSYVPPRRPPLPEVGRRNWCRSPIDHFVLARLEAAGLQPAPAAEREKLIRRLSLDLIGLPPTGEELDAFLSDTRPDAYERLVDRLLASPAYGEHQARKWLDLARYADSQGYAQDELRTIWQYRDWVIDALNRDLPFDTFTIEQLAGDLLPNPTEEQLLATAFHRNTMTNTEGGTDDEEFRHAAVVDRVNTTMQIWMGTTMGCVQCHSHKYDPITHEEYYRFFDFFNQTEDSDKPDNRPNLTTLSHEQQRQKEQLLAQIAALEEKHAEDTADKPVDRAPPTGPLPTRYVRIELPGKKTFLSLAEVQVLAGDENVALRGKASQVSTDFEGPAELAIDGNTDGHYFNAKSTTHTAAADDPWWEVDLGKSQTVARIVVWNRTDGPVGERLAGFRVVLLDQERRPLWVEQVAEAPRSSIALHPPRATADFSPAATKKLHEYVASAGRGGNKHPEIEQLRKQVAAIRGVPTPIMRQLPPERRRTTQIHIRGAYLDKGQPVTAGVPAAFGPLPDDAPRDRLGLARWLVSPANPLTARVAVNRHWEQLFGIGLVETSEDFGSQGNPPSHPVLLDWLAVEFVEQGWSMKKLCKTIVMSATYQQSSRCSPDKLAADPRNRLLARGPRFRLSAEQVRDNLLAVSGLLSRKMYGPPIRPPQPKSGLSAAFGKSLDWQTSSGDDRYRRGLYIQWRRTNPYPSLMTMDATNRTVCTVRRLRTNTPVAVFVTLNDPVYVEAAQALARLVVATGGATVEEGVNAAFRRVLSRQPSGAETQHVVQLYEAALAEYQADADAARQLATDPIGPPPEGADVAKLAAWTVVANTLLNLDETLTKD